MQPAVEDLVRLGPLPSTMSSDAALIQKFQVALSKLEKPVSDDDAQALVQLFGPDDCFGLAWTLLHAIETAPGWPLSSALLNARNEWGSRLKQRTG